MWRGCSVRGSSPHTRGALVGEDGAEIIVGIIPAYAGSTHLQTWKGWSGKDHPRIRGEHPPWHDLDRLDPGSSPHTRGARRRRGCRRRRRGIIPAYAGSTEVRLRRPWAEGDHPRIRGEHKDQHTQAMIMFGSSPHTRGARADESRHRRRQRIIPAYAGSTFGTHRVPIDVSDHPRIRGEHRAADASELGLQGSSPHTRGAPSSRMNSSKMSGIIPAYAGSTADVIIFRSIAADHPRIRGEHPPLFCPSFR